MAQEKLLERKLREEIRKRGGRAIKFFSPSFTGLPDRIILLPKAQIFFAEIKTTGKKPNIRQLAVHDWLASLGFVVFVVDSHEKLSQVLLKIDHVK